MAKTIKTLTPEAGRTDAAGLREHEADALVMCAADARQPWWRREACVEAPAAKAPLTLISNGLQGFPARGHLYQLQQPVKLVPEENPDQVAAKLPSFASERGGNAMPAEGSVIEAS
ncbi:hypothetical protein ACWGIU_09890 [Streptomyces sp. NPDC054840]